MLDRAEPPGILDLLRRLPRIFGEDEMDVRALEARKLEYRHLEVARALPGVFDMINEVVRDLGHTSAEHRISETLDQRNLPACFGLLPHHQIDLGGKGTAEPRQHHERVAAFDARVPRGHGA